MPSNTRKTQSQSDTRKGAKAQSDTTCKTAVHGGASSKTSNKPGQASSSMAAIEHDVEQGSSAMTADELKLLAKLMTKQKGQQKAQEVAQQNGTYCVVVQDIGSKCDEQESDEEETEEPKRKKTRKRGTAHTGSDEEDQGSASDQDSRQSEEHEGIEEIEERGKPSAAHQQQPKPRLAFKGKAAQRDPPEEDRDVEMEAPAEPEEVSDGLNEHERGLANTLRSQAPATPKKAKTVSGSSPSKSCKEAEKGPTTRGCKASESTRAPAEATSKPSSSRKIMEVSIPTSPPSRRKGVRDSTLGLETSIH
ncbi:hypothetical protein C8Q72DRAFT_887021 [Fomitopsis betulina]|nr:hypothetical protein C8Q72DRAFT_887021 [Fomitopsis betulina]